MKLSLKIFSAFAATSFAFLGFSYAQPQTYDTTPFYSGSTTTFGSGVTIGQTFTNVLAVQSMTYNFFLGSGGSSGDVTLTAVFGQWDDSTASFVGGTTVNLTSGAFIPASGTLPNGSAWGSPGSNLVNSHGSYATYAFQFDLSNVSAWSGNTGLLDNINGYVTTPSTTYALMLTNGGAATNLALGQTNTNAFAFGQAYQGGGSGDYFRDWTFSQISVTPNPVIPESSTIAAILGCVLVAGLVGFRLRQQRQLALAPVNQMVA